MTVPVTFKARKTAMRILQATSLRPVLAIVLGSGFDHVREVVETVAEIPYQRLSGFTPVQVEGHRGKVILGTLSGTPLLLLCGRSHYYEGHSMAEITFPVRALAACGIRVLVLTNAAGGINRSYQVGDFMGLVDHLNFMGENPLRGMGVNDRTCFVDLSQTYDRDLNRLLKSAARRTRVRLHWGVYAAVPGPCYETPAEIRALARLGADAVGMSTVPEAIVARQCGLRVVALSCVTNPAAGLGARPISHGEVLAAGIRVKSQAAALLAAFAQLVASEISV